MYISLSEKVCLYKSYDKIILRYSEHGRTTLLEENESGMEILLLCDGSRTNEEIVEQIMQKHCLDNDVKEDIESYINQHMENGIINQQQEENPVIIKFFDYSEMIVPNLLSLEITNVCNLRCNHCFNNSGANGKSLSWEIIRESIDTATDIGIPMLYLTGGEPFAHPDIEKILSRIKGKFVNITIATNAYHIENYISKIAALENCVLQVSIDGLEEKHNYIRGRTDAFQKTIGNIKKAVEAGIPVCTYFTLNEKNYEDMEAVVQLSKQLGCSAIKIAAVLKMGRASQNQLKYNEKVDYRSIILKLAQEYSDESFMVLNEKMDEQNSVNEECEECINKCGGGYKTIYVNANGRVTICATMQEISLGNVCESSLKSILKSKRLKDTKNIPSPNKKLCGECEHLVKCEGCIARIFEHSREECKLQNYEIFQEMCHM